MKYGVEIAIRENELAELSFEIEDYTERLSTIFEKYEATIGKLPSYYKGLPCRQILSYYNEVKKSFPIVKKNIRCYSSDLMNLIRILKTEDKKLSLILREDANDLVKKSQKIRMEKSNKELI